MRPRLPLLIAALALLPATARARDEGLLLAAAHAERIPLPGASAPSLRVEPLSDRIELKVGAAADRIGDRLARSPAAICPGVERSGGTLILRCRSRRIDARLSKSGGGWVLDLRELRGLPWRDDEGGPPIVAGAPEDLGLGGPCPGTSPAGRATCALARGDRATAERELAREPDHVGYASIRLGDLALLADRPADAARFYGRVDPAGPFGTLAQARICELFGGCLGTKDAARIFSGLALPSPLRTELDLRAARLEALVGDPAAAARFLVDRMNRDGTAAVCPPGQSTCAAVALAALRQPGVAGKEEALALYFALPDRLAGPLAAPLGRAAAEVCASLGAPVFGANLLAATTGASRPDELEGHLHQAADLFLRGGDATRAGVILDFVAFRFGAAKLREPAWAGLHRHARGSGSSGDPAGAAALADEATRESESLRELARALVAAARARSLAK